jgi:acetylornithine aminotransferase/acetylornithine/N-succinyldiaminopimelate aminotransferase
MTMKPSAPPSPPIVRNQFETVRELFERYVVPTYGRFDLALSRGRGCEVWDVNGRRYLDLGTGIAVCCLGHAHPEVTETLVAQSRELVHVSNLYYQENQGRLAQRLVQNLAPGKVFFCNSGAEANEGLYKLARRFGNPNGRFEIITALNSFHGRTLAGIAATGQEKIKQGFEPIIPGFAHVPFNDLEAIRNAITPATAAVLIEGIQGEGGLTMAEPDYLIGLRQLCDEHRLLLLWDGVQCGHFRSGRFQSFQRILEAHPRAAAFRPDGISMAKSLGNGFPIGAFWVRDSFADLLQPGSHGTTYGGTPLACAVALKVLDIIERDRLADNARELGLWLESEIQRLAHAYPGVIRGVRGTGFILGIELAPKASIPAFDASDKPAAIQLVNRLHQVGLLTIPAGAQVVRLLPPLNLGRDQATEAIELIEKTLQSVA